MKQELNPTMVGTFAKVGNEYGFIDSVFEIGYGFVTSSPTGWTGKIVRPSEVQLATNEERPIAKSAALNYYRLEITSLRRRLNANYEIDDPDYLNSLISTYEAEINYLSNL